MPQISERMGRRVMTLTAHDTHTHTLPSRLKFNWILQIQKRFTLLTRARRHFLDPETDISRTSALYVHKNWLYMQDTRRNEFIKKKEIYGPFVIFTKTISGADAK